MTDRDDGGDCDSCDTRNDGGNRDDQDDPELPPYPIAELGVHYCPLCGQRVTHVTINGPTDATVSPCGCRMPPEPLLAG